MIVQPEHHGRLISGLAVALSGVRRSLSHPVLPRTRSARVATCILVGLGAAAALAPVIAPYDPLAIHAQDRLLHPGTRYLLGTDDLGRDELSMLLYGARLSLSVAALAELVAIAFGVPLGLLAGFRGGALDALIMRVIDGLLGLPAFLIALAIVGLFGVNFHNLVIAIGVMNLPYLTRVVRGAVVIERGKPYVVAARSLGLSDFRLAFNTIVPNILSPVVVQVSFGLAVAVLQESALSFLGLGIQPPRESWGSLLANGYSLIRVTPWLAIFPGACIFVAVWCFNVLGDSLRDSLDPRIKTRTVLGR